MSRKGSSNLLLNRSNRKGGEKTEKKKKLVEKFKAQKLCLPLEKKSIGTVV